MIPIKDWRSERRILSTKLALNFASTIGLSIFEAPKAEFSNVYSEINHHFLMDLMNVSHKIKVF